MKTAKTFFGLQSSRSNKEKPRTTNPVEVLSPGSFGGKTADNINRLLVNYNWNFDKQKEGFYTRRGEKAEINSPRVPPEPGPHLFPRGSRAGVQEVTRGKPESHLSEFSPNY